jgi:DNA (cytosine-5)-methyltransferase 1
MTKDYKVLSLFSGIGGMDFGFGGVVIVPKQSIVDTELIVKKYSNFPNFVSLKKLNFSIVFQNDILSGARDICRLNNTDSNYNTTSIFDLVNSDYIFPEADVVIGGFPCQDFSHCGNRQGFVSNVSHNLTDDLTDTNRRGTLYKMFVKVVEQTKPKIFVAENVKGLLTMPGNPIDIIIQEFSELGYTVRYSLVKAEEHGIPQTRHRVIIIGILKSVENLSDDWYKILDNKTGCPIKPYFEHLLEPNVSNDFSQRSYSKAKRLDKGQGQISINIDGFSPTIRAEHHGNIEFRRHGDLERRLTVREAGLIQTFPPDYIFNTKVNLSSYKYIGNAVPPLLGYLIASKVNMLLTTYFTQ